MSSCFKNPNKKNLSAKDYTIKKRRANMFCDLRKKLLKNIDASKPIGTQTNDACVNRMGEIIKYKNKNTQLDMLAAFKDFREKDLMKKVNGQIFKNHFCPPYDISKNNVDISNNYTADNIQLAYGDGDGYGHLTTYFGGLNTSINSTSNSIYKNTYAEIKNINPDLAVELIGGFKDNKFKLSRDCSNNNIITLNVLKPSETPVQLPTPVPPPIPVDPLENDNIPSPPTASITLSFQLASGSTLENVTNTTSGIIVAGKLSSGANFESSISPLPNALGQIDDNNNYIRYNYSYSSNQFTLTVNASAGLPTFVSLKFTNNGNDELTYDYADATSNLGTQIEWIFNDTGGIPEGLEDFWENGYAGNITLEVITA